MKFFENWIIFNNHQIFISAIILWKIILSIIVGTVIGKERKKKKKPGGSRTFGLVCMGSTLLAILSLKLLEFGYNFDFVRLMSYGMVSIGFLGSGIIIQNKNKVEGLTTASTLWTTVPLGFCIGLGFYALAIICMIFIYLTLESKYNK